MNETKVHMNEWSLLLGLFFSECSGRSGARLRGARGRARSQSLKVATFFLELKMLVYSSERIYNISSISDII